MNEKFLEIAKKSGLRFSFEDRLSPPQERFAEFIIQECVTIIGPDGGYLIDDETANRIKEYFGIKDKV